MAKTRPTTKERAFAIVDVETTGGSPVTERIIEIAVIRVEGGRIVDSFQSLVDPEQRVPPMITAITGISADDLAGAPTFGEVATRVRELAAGAVFVAHNARFDYGFVRGEFARLGDPFTAKCLCTVRLSRRLDARFRHHDLSTLIDRWGLSCESRHRAYDDAYALWQLMGKFEDAYGREKMDEAISALLGHSALPQHMPKDLVAGLPDGPGVYIFYGPEGEVLYVGKSVNIKTRVMSHFTGDASTTRGMNMYQQVANIEARTTSGELGALLLESELIKSLQPLYNKVARRRQKLVLARASARDSGHRSVTLELADRIEPDSAGGILGVFKSRSQAKKTISELAVEHGLCEKLLGSESGQGACFGSQIGRCDGACVGKGSVEEYNKRFEEAFRARRIRTWPYKGPVIIEEKGDGGNGEAFVVDNWCLTKSVRYDEDGAADERELPHAFDYDNYKIIARYLLDAKNRRSVVPASETAALSDGRGETVIE